MLLTPGVYAVYDTPGVDEEYFHHPNNVEVKLDIPPRELSFVYSKKAPWINELEYEVLEEDEDIIDTN